MVVRDEAGLVRSAAFDHPGREIARAALDLAPAESARALCQGQLVAADRRDLVEAVREVPRHRLPSVTGSGPESDAIRRRWRIESPLAGAGRQRGGRMQLTRLERFLRLFTDVRPGEGATALLMFVNVFLILCAYYFIKPLRDGWIAISDVSGLSKMEVKAYTSFGQSLLIPGQLTRSSTRLS
jgi:hypothetical protein